MSKDWVCIEIGELFKTETGCTPSKKNPAYYGEGIPFVKPPDLWNREVKETNDSITHLGANHARILPSGSVLVTCIGNLGRVGIINKESAFNQQINAIRPLKGIEPYFVFYQAQSPLFRKELEGLSSATTVAIVNKGNFNRISFSFPPLPEQRAIVAKLEELFSELDAGIANLQRAQDQLKTYRQAVLKKAFEGELTRAWREQQTDLPSAEELLAQIQAERERYYQQQLAEWEDNGKQGKKPKTNKINGAASQQSEWFSILPRGWSIISPEWIASPESYSIGIGPFGSNLKVSDYKDSGVPLIFVRNITRNDYELRQKFILKEKYNELIAHSVKPLDILVTKMGDPPGDVSIYPQGAPNAILTSDCLKLRVWPSFADRKFYRYCIESVFVKRQLGLITQGVAQKKISAGRFKTLDFPFCSLKEQHQIVQEIESRLSVCDQVEKDIEANLKRAERLRQSILQKAFAGELLTEAELAACRAEPDWEPAEVLLERIKKSENK